MSLFKDLILEDSHFNSIPWTKKDIKLGIFLFLSIMLLFFLWVSFLYFPRSKSFLSIFFITNEIPILIIIWYLAVKRDRGGIKFLGVKKFAPKMIAVGFGLALLGYFIVFLYYKFLSIINIHPTPIDSTVFFKSVSFPESIFIGGAIVAPIIEETFCRGFVFGGLVKHYGLSNAAILSSIIFAIGHIPVSDPTSLGRFFIFGFFLSFLYYKSKSIIPGIIFHSLNNFVILFIAYKKFISA